MNKKRPLSSIIRRSNTDVIDQPTLKQMIAAFEKEEARLLRKDRIKIFKPKKLEEEKVNEKESYYTVCGRCGSKIDHGEDRPYEGLGHRATCPYCSQETKICRGDVFTLKNKTLEEEKVSDENKKAECPHAKLMAEYAQDALDCPEPWLLWEWRESVGWRILPSGHPSWNPNYEYRRKIDTVDFMGYQLVDDVIRSEEELQSMFDDDQGSFTAFMEGPFDKEYYLDFMAIKDYAAPCSSRVSDIGILHKTKEGAINYCRVRHGLKPTYDAQGNLLEVSTKTVFTVTEAMRDD